MRTVENKTKTPFCTNQALQGLASRITPWRLRYIISLVMLKMKIETDFYTTHKSSHSGSYLRCQNRVMLLETMFLSSDPCMMRNQWNLCGIVRFIHCDPMLIKCKAVLYYSRIYTLLFTVLTQSIKWKLDSKNILLNLFTAAAKRYRLNGRAQFSEIKRCNRDPRWVMCCGVLNCGIPRSAVVVPNHKTSIIIYRWKGSTLLNFHLLWVIYKCLHQLQRLHNLIAAAYVQES